MQGRVPVAWYRLNRTALIIIGALISLMIGVSASAQQAVMKSGVATREDIQHEWQKRMKTRVEARSNGRLKIEIFPGGTLGGNNVMIEGMLLGTIENFVAPGSFFVGVDPRFQVLDVPGLFTDVDHLYRTVRDPEFRQAYLNIGRAKGLVGLGVMAYGPTSFVTRRPIRVLDDFKGLKLRVFGSPLQTEPIKILGATPTPMALSEVMPAFQNRVIDGTLSGITIFTSGQFHTISKFLTATEYSMISTVALVSGAWFDKLPSDLQKILVEEADAVEGDLLAWVTGEINAAGDVWTKNGGEVIRLSQADQAEMMRRLSVVGDRVAQDTPAIREIYNLLKERAARHATR